MSSGGRKFSWARWLDEWKLAFYGVAMATREARFWAFFVPVFVVFGTILNLLSGGMAALNLIAATDFAGKLSIIGNAMLGIFGIGRNFLDWLIVFAICLLQAVLIGLIAVVWRHNKDQAENLESSGIVAGLAILGSGCPTCGTALLAPVIGAIFSTGGYALAGAISGAITIIAVLVALFSVKKVGCDVYAILLTKKRKNNDRKTA